MHCAKWGALTAWFEYAYAWSQLNAVASGGSAAATTLCPLPLSLRVWQRKSAPLAPSPIPSLMRHKRNEVEHHSAVCPRPSLSVERLDWSRDDQAENSGTAESSLPPLLPDRLRRRLLEPEPEPEHHEVS